MLLRRELDSLSTSTDLQRRLVQFEIGDAQHAFALHGPPTQEGLHPDHQLCHCERLRQVIVCACFEMSDFVYDSVARRQYKDRHVRIPAADPKTDLTAIQLRQQEEPTD